MFDFNYVVIWYNGIEMRAEAFYNLDKATQCYNLILKTYKCVRLVELN